MVNVIRRLQGFGRSRQDAPVLRRWTGRYRTRVSYSDTPSSLNAPSELTEIALGVQRGSGRGMRSHQQLFLAAAPPKITLRSRVI